MVDAQTKEVIKFENEESDVLKRRVLLTHEMTCQRCIKQNCGCGNKNERSGCPITVGASTLQFFMKCNQNCQSKAGNTRNRRRFKIMLTEGDGSNCFARVLCLSQEMFIHNNSKFGANKLDINNETKRTRKIKQDNEPRIRAVIPSSGTHNQLVVINGINFTEGLQAYLGQTLVDTRVITDTAISVVVPQLGTSGMFRVSLAGHGKSCYFQTPFRYVSSSHLPTPVAYDTISTSTLRGFNICSSAQLMPHNTQSALTSYDEDGNYANNLHGSNNQHCFANTPPQSPTGVAYNLAGNYSAHRNEMMIDSRAYQNENTFIDSMIPNKKRRA